ncbi:hypothetical protein [Nakamurella leprariae]|uniref:Uncharacterized protein n=1 Tax=Nakamurella leprariae TaxID=2803911 RepID=A0A938YE05_9ACTN|nr:hypothetical protein [Nakamurella leprariae]MBM9466023.1 hypothetical protein [Nakamurella leprariae]
MPPSSDPSQRPAENRALPPIVSGIVLLVLLPPVGIVLMMMAAGGADTDDPVLSLTAVACLLGGGLGSIVLWALSMDSITTTRRWQFAWAAIILVGSLLPVAGLVNGWLRPLDR